MTVTNVAPASRSRAQLIPAVEKLRRFETPLMAIGQRELMDAAAPVLDALAERMSGMSVAIMLSDSYAGLVARWWTDERLGCVQAIHGSLCHQFTTQSSSDQAAVHGIGWSTYAAPVIHPDTGQIAGVVTVVCPRADASGFLVAFVQETADHIHDRLRNSGNVKRDDEVSTDPTGPRSPKSRDSALLAEQLLIRLGGSSPRWQASVKSAAHAASDHGSILVSGPRGSGKLELARAVHEMSGRRGDVTIFDTALLPFEDQCQWFSRLRRQLKTQGMVVLRHTETLEPKWARALDAVFAEHHRQVKHANKTGRVASLARIVVLRTAEEAGLGPVEFPTGWLADHVIEIPSLRDRIEDLADLVQRLLAKRGLSGLFFERTAIAAMTKAPWPGNIRQLDLVVGTSAGGRTVGGIAPEDLPAEIVETALRPLTDFERLEHRAIVAALRVAGGNKKSAAQSLGISRSTMYRKLRAFGVTEG